jgi:hypothetical protein
MTNEQKIKAYLAAGHHVKVTILINNTITIVHDNWWRFVSSNGSLFDYGSLDDKIVEPIPRKPNYKVWDKVVVLDIAREVNEFDSWFPEYKKMVSNVVTITSTIDTLYEINWWALVSSWVIAPYFDDEKPTKIQELESQLAQIQKEIELLKV